MEASENMLSNVGGYNTSIEDSGELHGSHSWFLTESGVGV